MRRSVGAKRCNMRRVIGRSLFLESLESRIVLDATSAHVHPAAAIIGTISGVVTNDVTGTGVKNDKVVLYNSRGKGFLSERARYSAPQWPAAQRAHRSSVFRWRLPA